MRHFILLLGFISCAQAAEFGDLDIKEICFFDDCQTLTPEYEQELFSAFMEGVFKGVISSFTGEKPPGKQTTLTPVTLHFTTAGHRIAQNDLVDGETEWLGNEEKLISGNLYIVDYYRRWSGSGWVYYSNSMIIEGPPVHQH